MYLPKTMEESDAALDWWSNFRSNKAKLNLPLLICMIDCWPDASEVQTLVLCTGSQSGVMHLLTEPKTSFTLCSFPRSLQAFPLWRWMYRSSCTFHFIVLYSVAPYSACIIHSAQPAFKSLLDFFHCISTFKISRESFCYQERMKAAIS